ncbi:MAG TPA: hypothetical protein VI383_05090 [Gemmatimonadales bacterium]|nr:hypothetical protein [Gemmatimonadales bacterium]
MPHIWIEQSPEWFVLPLEREELALSDIPPRQDRGALLVKSAPSGRPEWHLLARDDSGITVNGLPLFSGVRTLLDRDEIGVPGLGPLFFSTERLARVEPLPAAGPEIHCPRCRQPVAPGTPAVRCPSCEVWHHSSEELPCWTYAETCALCRQSTAFDTGYQWTPEDL